MQSRRGFSLLEVMVALAILTVSLVILVETQSSAVVLTQEAERIVTATDLAQVKLNDALITVEEEGFQVSDVYESGDFDNLGSDILNAEFGEELEDFHWEYTVTEVDISGIGDAGSAMEGLGGGGGGSEDGQSSMLGRLLGGGGGGGGGGDVPSDAPGTSPAGDMLGALGFGPDQITETLSPFIREVRVRVWWGRSSKQAEEQGTEVIMTSHVINPTGILSLEQQGIAQ